MATFLERITQLYEEARDENHMVGRKDFADQLGVTVGQVNGWLSNSGRPNFETLKQIAKKKNVSTSWLIGETDCRNQQIASLSEALPPKAQKEYGILLEFLQYKYRE